MFCFSHIKYNHLKRTQTLELYTITLKILKTFAKYRKRPELI